MATPASTSTPSEISDVERDYDVDGWLSESSGESELSATKIALNIDHYISWEHIHNCHQAAYSDIPSKFQHCLSIFDTKDSLVNENHLPQKRPIGDEKFDALFEVSGATKTTSEPWSLPIPSRPEFSLYPDWVRISEVSQVYPTAALYVDVDCSDVTQDAGPPMTALGSFDSNMSPLVHATGPCFASTVFAAASHVAPDVNVTHNELRGYNRLATTSLLRQAHALQIDTPVFGVLLMKDFVAIHIDWYEECDGGVECFSAFYPLDDEERDIKRWHLDQSSDERELFLILSNLRKFTFGQLASQVRLRFESVRHNITPWKWNASNFSGILTKVHLRQPPEESSEDRLKRWQKSFEITEQEASDPWLKEKRAAETMELIKLKTCKDFLSPPSTPGDVSIGC